MLVQTLDELLQDDPMDEYDEYEVIDADTKRRLGRFSDLKSARNMAQGWANAPHGKHRSIEIWGVVVTRTREQVERVTRRNVPVAVEIGRQTSIASGH